MMEADVVVVGGGAAGLTTAGALKHVGLEAVVLDKDDQVGGVWARRYERLRLHTVRPFSGLAHYPIPRRYPWYIPKNQFAGYLQEYARHFDLDVRLEWPVAKIRPEGEPAAPTWVVEGDKGAWRSRVVVVALGHYGRPTQPAWPGQETYQGRLLHSVEYRTGQEFAGRRVLVVGTGNSGSEICVDLVEQGAAFVANSVRTPPPVVPRDVLGFPVQAFGMLLTPLPPGLADRIGYAIARTAMGNLGRYGLGRPAWLPFTAHRVPIIDVGYAKALKRGQIQLRPTIGRLTPGGVVYEDGREEAFDVIVAATGFQTGLATLLEAPGLVDERGYPRFPSGRPTSYPGFYFMGYTESVRGHLYEANCDSRRLARTIAAYLQPA
ncbi:MAG: NAD(P)/FAD-dependent oxidoreductase [Chloroflexi bacterium]|nr:NAD(P)/FAD-dependent oxidoreductase [Chloroflexota bacterium]MCI0579849.1 NAD(P)/FAD-dependent oxidoreductase [Chloroflexota bacterium]MCI0645674.1 NAD(P)/FAD-dependent oxidoreductase [Chloroflexota bacterium]MCI0725586.1 NAD(P)/FAD-dependent oxidoreductase [Chloroflexota bacterium]